MASLVEEARVTAGRRTRRRKAGGDAKTAMVGKKRRKQSGSTLRVRSGLRFLTASRVARCRYRSRRLDYVREPFEQPYKLRWRVCQKSSIRINEGRPSLDMSSPS